MRREAFHAYNPVRPCRGWVTYRSCHKEEVKLVPVRKEDFPDEKTKLGDKKGLLLFSNRTEGKP